MFPHILIPPDRPEKAHLAQSGVMLNIERPSNVEAGYYRVNMFLFFHILS
jgi:hypothetical protein